MAFRVEARIAKNTMAGILMEMILIYNQCTVNHADFFTTGKKSTGGLGEIPGRGVE
jgi:hypothetical protein